MIDSPEILANLIYALLCAQDHLIGGIAIIDTRIILDSDGNAFEVTVRRMPTPDTRARAAAAKNN